MSTVSAPARRRPASAPPAPSATVRHGKCSLHLSINGTRYRLTRLTPPAGFKAVWVLRKQAPDHSAVYQVAVEKGRQPACTCPDFTINGAVCKHIGSLKAYGLIAGRKARPAAARRSHARRLAESPADSPAPSAPASPPVRGGFAAGFRRAVDEHLAMRRMAERIDGTPRPETETEPPPEGFLCAYCGEPFDPAVSRDPHFCGPCAEEGGLQMIHTSSLFVDRAGVIRPDLIPLAAFLCAEEYEPYARSIILDHAAAGFPLDVLTRPTPEGWVVLEPFDLAGAEEALRRGGPAPIAGGAPSLADQVAVEADRLRRSVSPIGGFLADQLERVAQLIAFTGARSPQDFADRIEIHERDLLAREYDRGFSDGEGRTSGYCPR